jgi:hypothetical protein
VDEAGRAIPAEEARRRYEAAGVPALVRVVPERLFTAGEVLDYFRVTVSTPDEWAPAVPILWTADGPRLAESPDPGKHRVFTGRPRLAPVLSEAVEFTAAGEEGVTVPLPSRVDVRRVRFVDAVSGAPLAGAMVTPWFEYGDDQLFLPGSPLETDPGGEVEIPVLEDAVRGRGRQPTWWIETTDHAGLTEWWALRNVDAAEAFEAKVYATATVTGTAYLTSGEPAAGKTLFWHRKGRVVRAAVNEDGSFALAGIATSNPGESRVTIFLVEDLERGAVRSVDVTVSPGKTTEADVGSPDGLSSRAAVSGRITAGGEPVAGAFIVTNAQGKGGGEGFVQTDAEGSFRKADLPPGKVYFEAYFGDPRAVDDFSLRRRDGPLDLVAGQDLALDFDLPEGAFLVTVVDDETGKAITGAVALGAPEDREAGTDRFPGFTYRPGWGGFVGEDGRLLLRAMLPGEAHTLRAGADGYGKAEVTGQVPGPADRPVEVTIRLKKK